MSLRRLLVSAAAMTAIGALLSTLTPTVPSMAGAMAHAQRTVDAGGADALVVATVGLLAWAVWLWGAVGLGLTALAAAPGLLGAAGSILVRLVLPAAARRGAAGLLGLSLGVAPLLGAAPVLLPAVASAADSSAATTRAAVPDWPAATPPAEVPDWPSGRPTAPDRSSGPHVVLRGECLWDIAADRLARGRPAPPTEPETARAVHAWWSANAPVIGPDPDLLLPGQVLTPPAGP
jgi:hypothetical protein